MNNPWAGFHTSELCEGTFEVKKKKTVVVPFTHEAKNL